MRSSSSRSDWSLAGLSVRGDWLSMLFMPHEYPAGPVRFPGSAARGKTPERGHGHTIAHGIATEMAVRAVVDAQPGELQFERRQVGDQGGVPVQEVVAVQALEAVVTGARRQ